MAGLLLLLGYRRMVWNFHMDFYISVVNGELSDIPGHYNLESSDSSVDEMISCGPGGFWVAVKERCDGNRPEIVGYVGLGMISCVTLPYYRLFIMILYLQNIL